MEALWPLLELAGSLSENLLLLGFLTALFPSRLRARGTWCLLLLFTCLLTAASFITGTLVPYNGFYFFVPVCLLFFYAQCFLVGGTLQKFVTSVSLVVLVAAISMVTSLVLGAISKMDASTLLCEPSGYRLTGLIVSKLILFWLVVSGVRIGRKSKAEQKFALSETVMLVIVPVVTLVAIVTVNLEWVSTEKRPGAHLYQVVIMACILLQAAAFYFLIARLARENQNQMELQLLKQERESVKIREAKIMGLYDELAREQHDRKNHAIFLAKLLEKGETDTVRAHLSSEIEGYSTSYGPLQSSSDAVNSICGIKFAALSELGVKVKSEIVGDIGGVEEIDYVTILGNLLDNVIDYYRAHSGMADKLLEFSIREENGDVVIRVRNTVEKLVLGENPRLKTTKAGKNHGKGLGIVRAHVRSYQGDLSFYELDENVKMFCVLCDLRKRG